MAGGRPSWWKFGERQPMFCRNRHSIVLSLLVVGVLLLPAQERASAQVEQIDLVKPADTTSPRATLKSFIDSCNQAYVLISREHYFQRDNANHRSLVRRILDCIDDREIPEFARDERAAEVAMSIKEVLDRVELPPYDEIPDAEMIEAADGEPRRWQIPGTRLIIVRIEEGPRKHEYVFSAGTVDRAIEYFEDMKGLPYRTAGPAVSPGFYRWYVTAPVSPWIGNLVDRMPVWMKSSTLSMAHWKWLGLAATLTLSLMMLQLIYRAQRQLAIRFRNARPWVQCLTISLPILAVMVPIWFQFAAAKYVSLRGNWLYGVSFAANIATLLTIVVLIFSAINRVATSIIASPSINPRGLDAQFIRIVSKLSSLVAAVIVFLEGGQYLGIPISTLLASAGVGGLAMALAAQDTLKNFFGTIMLMADKPFRVGERIVTAGYDGVVEDIGLRSTRIRLLNGHQVTIPNDKLATSDIENIGRRPYIRRVANLHIPLRTPRAKLEKAIAVIRESLENHEGMSADFPPRVFFNEFNEDSFNLRVMYWYQPAEYWDYLAFTERLNLKIIGAFEDQQIEFSLPLRITNTEAGNP